jgi:hypothetical protein
MPHRGKRMDPTREWALLALRRLIEGIDKQDRPLGLAMVTVDGAGITTIHSINCGSIVTERSIVTDPEMFARAAQMHTVNVRMFTWNGDS